MLKLGPLIGTGALAGVDKFLDHFPVLALSMIAASLQLKGNGQVSLGLFFRGYTCIYTTS